VPAKERFFRDVEIKMTDAELAEAGRSLAAADYEVELLEEQKKNALKEWTTKIEAKQLMVRELRDKVRSGTKIIAIECRRLDNQTTFAVETFRIDTGELIDSRPMTTAERNAALNPTLPGVPTQPPDDGDAKADDEEQPAEDVPVEEDEDEPAAPAPTAPKPAPAMTSDYADPWERPEDSEPPAAPRKRGRPKKEPSATEGGGVT